MVTKVELYDAFGELMYALALADGVIQNEELSALENIVSNHEWASEIKWSFHYEKKKSKSLEDAYANALMICKEYGPSPDYPFLFDVLEKIATASEGVDPAEKQMIDDFKTDLLAHFHKVTE